MYEHYNEQCLWSQIDANKGNVSVCSLVFKFIYNDFDVDKGQAEE